MANHISIKRDVLRKELNKFPDKQRPIAEHLLLALLIDANWKDGTIITEHEVLALKRGQVPIGLEAMAKRLGRTIQQLRTILSKMKINNQITSETTNRGTILTIVNYDSYVYVENETNKQKNENLTINQQATNNSEEVHLEEVHLEESKEVPTERENSTSSVRPNEQNYSLSETGKDLDLKTDTPVNRWIKKFQAYRPTAGHPLATLSPHDIADVRQRVAELIEWQTEPKAIELLQKAFEKPPRPSTVKQAVFACTKIVEASPPSSTGQHADTTPDVSQSIYKEWTGHAR